MNLEGHGDKSLGLDEIQTRVSNGLATLDLDGKRVLLVVPDLTRTAPIGILFRLIHDELADKTDALDVIFALGTHPAMTDAQQCERLEISRTERETTYGRVRLFNHEWDNPDALVSLGDLSAEEIAEITGGLFSQNVPVTINKLVLDYDHLIIIGPVFPHEVVGFSGGNKYLFPGIGGGEILNFFHWLGALITNVGIIGHEQTAVRRVVDLAAQLVPVAKFAFCLVVGDEGLAGLYWGTPEAAWREAVALSDRLHIVYKPHPYHTVLSCAPPMYDELWVAGKCMYKLEPVVADGGELIIYAPHLHEISVTHGEVIRRIGYHIRDYFLADWEKFRGEPWGVLAHSTHVRGAGEMRDGVEHPRIKVTLATQLSPELCEKIGLGYRDPVTIRPEDFANREDEGVLLVPKAGEQLFRLEKSIE